MTYLTPALSAASSMSRLATPAANKQYLSIRFNVVGIISSSRRYKHDIQPMDKASETLYRLKPVTFKYNSDRKGTTQYGLIAEEVAEVDPELVVARQEW